MSAPAIRLICGLATLATASPVALHGQGDDSTTRGYAPAGPSSGAAAPAGTAGQASVIATARAILQPGRSDDEVSRDIQAADIALNQADAEIAAATLHRNQAAQLVQAAERRIAELEAVGRRLTQLSTASVHGADALRERMAALEAARDELAEIEIRAGLAAPS